ncbi:pyridoxal phosphate-dependent decarboxylase family protein [Sporocytophaga myxococcoides]|uniref:pyridoxal phosphate-dependent decarboxylase family protein n=1 Tax=Sporocytophaga myxococcoides TaxID=153721 RepID=UPI00041244E9|nr:aspartate aminotransferase family protein [Sporocytophaga myxococcoides]
MSTIAHSISQSRNTFEKNPQSMITKVKKTLQTMFVRPKANDLNIFNHKESNIQHYEKTIIKVTDYISNHLRSSHKPFSGVTPALLRPKVNDIDLNIPLTSLDAVLAEVDDIYTKHAILFHLPQYIAHLNCPILIPALAAEVIVSSLNSSLDTWDQSAGGTLMEMKLIEWTCKELGLGPLADGVFTSGGTQSNLMGMMLARDYFLKHKLQWDVKKEGLPTEASKFRIFCSEKSHFSLRKAAILLGLGEQAIVPVKTNKQYQLDIKALQECVDNEKAAGNIPIAIVATAGTTDFGSIDPLEEIGSFATRHQLWFHVDAAYGCGLLLSDKYKYLINGIEHADSVTVDYHKAFFQPVSSSALLVRNGASFEHITHHADYLNPKEHEKDGYPNQVNKSIQTTRRFDALKLWFTLRLMGKETLGSYIDAIIELAAKAAKSIEKDKELELLNYPEISTILFRYNPYGVNDISLNAINAYIRKKMFESGKALIASTKVNKEVYLKFTILNPETTIDDIKNILTLIKLYGCDYAKNN